MTYEDMLKPTAEKLGLTPEQLGKALHLPPVQAEVHGLTEAFAVRNLMNMAKDHPSEYRQF